MSRKSIAEIAAEFDRAVAAKTNTPANVNTGTRYGGQSVINIDGGGDYHEGNYAEHVYGDQASR